MARPVTAQATSHNAALAANERKHRIVGMKPTLPTVPNHIQERKTASIVQTTVTTTADETKTRDTIRGNSGHEGVLKRKYSIQYTQNSTINCNGIPTENWQRRRKVVPIKKYNAKNETHKEYSQWIA